VEGRRSRAEAVTSAVLFVAILAAFFAFAAKVLEARGAPPPSALREPWSLPVLLSIAPCIGLTALIAARGLASRGAVVAAVFVLGAAVMGALATPIGHPFAAALGSAVLALMIGAVAPLRAPAIPSKPAWWILWLATAAVYSAVSMYRHASFGSGSWDMGCMVHNFYRSSRFLDTTSTVLGDVDFLGDHFMIGIYLYAPLFWIHSSGYMVLFVQSVSLGAAAPAIFLIARAKGADVISSLAVALSTAFSFGLQSAGFFDSHEITVGFGFVCFGLYAFEIRRFGWATASLFTFALFKESLGAYVVALGLLAVWRGIRDADTVSKRYGLAWIGGGAVWFVLVNRVFMPILIARANAPEAHETFAEFGPTVFSALVGIITHPLQAIGALVVPHEKLASLAVTFFGVAGLAITAPEIGIAALPLVAERFLSSKSMMWEMGYHYAAPLALYAGWAAAIGWGRASSLVASVLSWWCGAPRALAEARAPMVLAITIVSSMLLVNGFGYRHVANFFHPKESYYSSPAKQVANRSAVAFVEERLPREAKIAVQNRILPHLADRPSVYRLGDHGKADFILLSAGENAWPHHDGYAVQLERTFARDPALRAVFREGTTVVFARVSATDLPAVR
jgi:uncharacterized membrane protein